MEDDSAEPKANDTVPTPSSDDQQAQPRSFLAVLIFLIGGAAALFIAYWVFVVGFGLLQLFTPWGWWGYHAGGEATISLPYKPTDAETKEICDTYFGNEENVLPQIKSVRDTVGTTPYAASIQFYAKLQPISGRREPSESKCYYNGNIQISLDYGDGSEQTPLDLTIASSTLDGVYVASHTYSTAGAYHIQATLSASRPLDSDILTHKFSIGLVAALPETGVPQSVRGFYDASLQKNIDLNFCKSEKAQYYYEAFDPMGSKVFFNDDGIRFMPDTRTRTVCVLIASHDPANPDRDIASPWSFQASRTTR